MADFQMISPANWGIPQSLWGVKHVLATRIDPPCPAFFNEVEYTWPFFFTQRGHMADACSGWTEWFPAHHVRKGAA